MKKKKKIWDIFINGPMARLAKTCFGMIFYKVNSSRPKGFRLYICSKKLF